MLPTKYHSSVRDQRFAYEFGVPEYLANYIGIISETTSEQMYEKDIMHDMIKIHGTYQANTCIYVDRSNNWNVLLFKEELVIKRHCLSRDSA